MSRPKVSIVCISYNQEKYIEAALKGFLDQEANFDFEIIIADDGSTDNTQKIIRDFAKNSLSIFKLILREKNIGIQENLYSALNAAQGEYIALCEGDDFWTNPQKLQMQADFLDKNKDYGLCFHAVKVFFQNGEGQEYTYPDIDTKPDFSIEELLRENYIQTNSVMYRRRSYKNMPKNILPLDWYLHLYHAQYGKIGFINTTMSSYRRHEGGVWWNSHNNLDEIWKKHALAHIGLYVEILKIYGKNPEHKIIIYEHITDMLNNLTRVDTKYKSSLFEQATTILANHVKEILKYQTRAIKEMNDELKSDGIKVAKLQTEINQKDQLIQDMDKQIKMIKSSKIWRTRNKAAKYFGRKPV